MKKENLTINVEKDYLKKAKRDKIIHTIVVFGFVLFTIFSMIKCASDPSVLNDFVDSPKIEQMTNQENNNDNTIVSNKEYNKDDLSTEQTIEYTKGEIVDNVYINEWANIQFDLNAGGWENADAKSYSEMDSDVVDCGFFGKRGEDALTIAFIDISDDKNKDIEVYLNESISDIKDLLTDADCVSAAPVEINKTLYLKSSVSGKVEDMNMCISMYMHKVNDRIVVITMTDTCVSDSESEINGFQ